MKDGLVIQILMMGLNGIFDIGWVEDLLMMKDKLLD